MDKDYRMTYCDNCQDKIEGLGDFYLKNSKKKCTLNNGGFCNQKMYVWEGD